MGLFKVKIEQGAFIDDVLYRMDEIVELKEGLDPLWGVKCDINGNELEDHSAKIRKSMRIGEHLAKSIESDNKAMASLARENAELTIAMANMQEQIAKLTESMGTHQTGTMTVEPVLPPMDKQIKEQVAEAVNLLEDSNDAHWTTKGEPKLDELKSITGLELSRADVDSANDRRRVKPAA